MPNLVEHGNSDLLNQTLFFIVACQFHIFLKTKITSRGINPGVLDAAVSVSGRP